MLKLNSFFKSMMSLILDTPKKEIDSVINLLTDSMMGAASLDVPLEIDVGVGDNWDQAH